MKKNILFLLTILFLSLIIKPDFIFAQQNNLIPEEAALIEINFFYSKTCPHCLAEEKFLEKIEEKYPQVKINRYLINEQISQDPLKKLCEECNTEKYIGLVPLTFVEKDFFPGFDNQEGIGKQIEESIQKQIKEINFSQDKEKRKIHIPFINGIEINKYSLPLQAMVLGFFDGFNVCSLEALILILGLVLVLRSRKKILIFGGIYILTTTFIYAILIIFWSHLFFLLAPYLKIMRVLIGLLGIFGGIYFLRQFIKFKKYGPHCQLKPGKGIIAKFSLKIQTLFKKSKNIITITSAIFLFAAIITIIEFPCSAVIPVFFAGILAEAKLPAFFSFLYIAIYMLFYMLDEIIIFLLALFTMTIRLSSSNFMTWITLIEAIIFFLFGAYYLFG
ncbi:MAG: hypothetical protein CEN91_583 [Candidatus Berkelbacteria bacterium Licking1014_85]|uniref:Thioredoxin domain-containing protein n=1 Tax=Candidatus Berkelbacteria bacterium Licking1014_85 TaxID=2017148 RepID=A0A554LG74_9BACT|nr:MAG: hypothetical protein CEN91_583 [Candidatus Berkelbacteria bacterium Licking1014_85]